MAIGIFAPSVNEMWQRASTLENQLRIQAASLVEGKAVDARAYRSLRGLRRQAQTVHAQLSTLHAGGCGPQFEKDNPTKLHMPGVSTSGPVQAGFGSLLKSLEASPFLKKNGEAILKAKPRKFGVGDAMLQRTLDITLKTTLYSMKNPITAGGIVLASLAAKLLFVYLCWKAIKSSVTALFGSAEAKKTPTNAPVPASASPSPPPGCAISPNG